MEGYVRIHNGFFCDQLFCFQDLREVSIQGFMNGKETLEAIKLTRLRALVQSLL